MYPNFHTIHQSITPDEIKTKYEPINPKPSNEEIALRLVEAWVGQSDSYNGFSAVCSNYLDMLDTLNARDKEEH